MESDRSSIPPIYLYLFGSGYRAMLFHVGALKSLNRRGLLSKLVRVVSVSGGSIVAATLAAQWNKLDFVSGVALNFETLIASGLEDLSSTDLSPYWLIAAKLAGKSPRRAQSRYDGLTMGKSFADLCDQSNLPEFVFQATNFQTGGVWRFGKDLISEDGFGCIRKPRLKEMRLSMMVEASASLPPFAPFLVKLDPLGDWIKDESSPHRASNEVMLCDGSASDDFDVADVPKGGILFVSDASMPYQPLPTWGSLGLYQGFTLRETQAYYRRTRRVQAAFEAKTHRGACWQIGTPIDKSYSLECPADFTRQCALMHTGFKNVDRNLRRNLSDTGFVCCDSAIEAASKSSLLELQMRTVPDASPHGSFQQKAAAAA